MSNTKKCELSSCENEFALNKFAPHQRFCGVKCKRKWDREKSKLGATPADQPGQSALFQKQATPKTPLSVKAKEEKEEVRKRTPIAPPAGMDISTQFVYNLQNKEIDRWEDAYREERSKRKKAKEELEKVRHELAELKTDSKIKTIEDEYKRPSGLDGLTDKFTSLLDNPNIGPHIGQFIGNLINGGGAAQLQGPAIEDPETQQAAIDIVNWYALQEKTTQQAFRGLVSMIETVQDPGKVGELIGRLLNVAKGGSTINTPHKATGTAGMTL